MSSRIGDYALISDLHTGPLVSRSGSIDWLCFPRYDSPSIFSAILGSQEHGHWLLAPAAADAEVADRSYLRGSFVLQTHWRQGENHVRVTEFMPLKCRRASIVRRIEGIRGTMRFRQELVMRMDYARSLPWVCRAHDQEDNPVLVAIAGPSALLLRGPHLPVASGNRHEGEFEVHAGDVVDFELLWYPSHRAVPPQIDVQQALSRTLRWWQQWAHQCKPGGKYGTQVERSLLVLRALTHIDTGGIVAAATTSLPEQIGGERNWDYRYCWLRDAALTIEAMLTHGFAQEAVTWRNWLLRAVAGDPEDLQIVYGLGGERDIDERILPHLPGHENSRPVRIGNGAMHQYQADVVGEVMIALELLRNAGGVEDHFSWPLQCALLRFVEKHFDQKDQGLWEMRGDPHYFTHSRVMMWAAFDRGIKGVREHGLPGPDDRWERLRDKLWAEVMEHGFDTELNSFTQVYGGKETDASLLALAQVGFLDYTDERMLGTVAQIERELVEQDGFVLRYRTESEMDGLQPGEHPFLACSFWLVEQYARSGRVDDAHQLMDRLISCGNELGLLSEEYDPGASRMIGNFPQAFSHLALVRAADALHRAEAEV